MLINQQVNFTLTGCGSLEGYRVEDGKNIVMLRMLFNQEQSLSFEVLLDCEVENLRLLSILDPVVRLWRTNIPTALSFQVICTAFRGCHNGWSKDDPDHMLLFDGKLTNVKVEPSNEPQQAQSIGRLSEATASTPLLIKKEL